MRSTKYRSILLSIAMLSSVFFVSGQNALLDVPEALRTFRWHDNKEYIISGHSVTMLSGETFTRYRNQDVGEYTTLFYQSLDQVIDSVYSQSRRNNWSEEDTKKMVDHYTKNAPGGCIRIFISRYEQSQANTRFWFIILKNEKDEKILESDLQYQAPETPEGLGWWNYYEFLIETSVEEPFYVHLNNKTSDFLTDFRYLVKPIENPIRTQEK